MRIRMVDIARELNLSVSTVSKALQNKRDISPATRKKIQKIAKKLGYKPDPALSALIAHRTELKVQPYSGHLAMVSTWLPYQDWIVSSSAQDLYRGALEQSRRLGYDLDYWFISSSPEEQKKLTEILSARGIQGALILPNVSTPWQTSTCWDSFSKVVVFGNPSVHDSHCVASHHYADMTLVLEQLKHRGYRRPGLIVEEQIAITTDFDWLGSFLAHASWFPDFSQECIFTFKSEYDSSWQKPKEKIRHWLKQARPDVVIANSALFLDWIQQEGGSRTNKIGYCALSLAPQDMAVSGIIQPIAQIGSQSIRKLVSLLQQEEHGPVYNPSATLLHGAWNEGKTLRSKLIGLPFCTQVEG